VATGRLRALNTHAFETVQVPAAATVQFSYPVSIWSFIPETELSNYAAEMCSGTVLNCSAIEFWQARKTDIDLISAPASQAYAERLFSICGD